MRQAILLYHLGKHLSYNSRFQILYIGTTELTSTLTCTFGRLIFSPSFICSLSLILLNCFNNKWRETIVYIAPTLSSHCCIRLITFNNAIKQLNLWLKFLDVGIGTIPQCLKPRASKSDYFWSGALSSVWFRSQKFSVGVKGGESSVPHLNSAVWYSTSRLVFRTKPANLLLRFVFHTYICFTDTASI